MVTKPTNHLSIDDRRALCGTYHDTRFPGDRVNIGGVRLDFAQATFVLADGRHMPGGEYAWPTVAHLIDEGTWTREGNQP